MDIVSHLRLASGLVNARALVRRFAIAFGDLPYELRSSAHEGRQRALHYRSALLRAFTTALHETSNGGS